MDTSEVMGTPLMRTRVSGESGRAMCLVKDGDRRWFMGLSLDMRIS